MNKAFLQKAARFQSHVLSVLALVFPGARVGRDLDTVLESDIEDTPFRFYTRHFKDWGDGYELLRELDEEGKTAGDSRPCALVMKADRREPLVVMGLSDFALFLETNLYPATPEDKL